MGYLKHLFFIRQMDFALIPMQPIDREIKLDEAVVYLVEGSTSETESVFLTLT